MTIKVSDLKEFFKRSSKIKSASIMPVYSFILIEFFPERTTFTKTNGNTFCKHEVEADNQWTQQVLIEEKRLSALVLNAIGTEITIELKGTNAILKDKANTVSLPTDEVKNFPTFPPSEDCIKYNLDSIFIMSFFQAKSFVQSNIENQYSFVYFREKEGANYMFATNGAVMYLRKFDNNLPEITLSQDACSILSAYQNIEYYTSGNYDFYNTGCTVYGFAKTQYNSPEFAPIIKAIDRSKHMKINRQDLVSFCDLICSFAIDNVPIVSISQTGLGLHLSFEEKNFNVDSKKEIFAEKTFTPEAFSLNATLLAALLKVFTSEEINIHPASAPLFVFEHPEEEGLTMVLATVGKAS